METCTHTESTSYPVQVDVKTTHEEILVESHPVVIEILQESNITIGGEVSYQYLTIANNNQSVFDLPYAIPFPNKSRLYLNGQKQVYGVDYVINASVLNYSGVALATTDYLEIYW